MCREEENLCKFAGALAGRSFHRRQAEADDQRRGGRSPGVAVKMKRWFCCRSLVAAGRTSPTDGRVYTHSEPALARSLSSPLLPATSLHLARRISVGSSVLRGSLKVVARPSPPKRPPTQRGRERSRPEDGEEKAKRVRERARRLKRRSSPSSRCRCLSLAQSVTEELSAEGERMRERQVQVLLDAVRMRCRCHVDRAR